MVNVHKSGIWVAVRVQRGFITEVKAFIEEKPARRQELSWRREMNPDYDETEVMHVYISK